MLLSCFPVNIFDVSDARLLQGESSPTDSASKVLLAGVSQLMPVEHPPEVEPAVAQLTNVLLG